MRGYLLNRLIATIVTFDHRALPGCQFIQAISQRVLTYISFLLPLEASLMKLFHHGILEKHLLVFQLPLEIAYVIASKTACPGEEIQDRIITLPVFPKRQARLLKHLLRIRSARKQRDDVAKHHVLASHQSLSKLLMILRVHGRQNFLNC